MKHKIIAIILIIAIISNIIYNKNKNKNKIIDSFTNNSKNLLFTSAGDNTEFYKHWLDKNREYDVWCVYYGNNDENYNKYEQLVDKIWRHKGSKFQNFYYIYNNYKELLNKYDNFFLLDDDIIINTDNINELFKISKKYNLWICQPAFTVDSKISYPYFNKVNVNNYLRYVNYVEVGVPLFSKYALFEYMKWYDPILIGWGVDYFYIWVLGTNKTDKYAIIDSIQCINPHDNQKQNKTREHNNIKNYDKEFDYWIQIKEKYKIPDLEYKVFSAIPKYIKIDS